MPNAQVSMSVRAATDDVNVIDINGEITAFSEQVLTESFSEAAQGDTKAVVLNFGDLEYMNSGGIGLLVTTLIRANRGGQRLLAYGLNDHYREIFSLTRLDEAIGIYDDEASAVAGL